MDGTQEAAASTSPEPGAVEVSLTRLLQAFVAGSLVLGYLVTASFFPGHQGREYALLSLVSAVASALFVASAMKESPTRILRIMLLVVFCLGYYAQFFWLVVDRNVDRDLAAVTAANLHPEAMLDVFRETTWSFAGLAALAIGMDRIPWGRRPLPPVSPAAGARIGKLAIVVAAVLLVLILPVMAAENIGLMAARPPQLPFRIAGWSIYGLRMLVPGLFLLAAATGEKIEGSNLLRAAVIGLVVAGVGDMLITTSKSSLVLAFIRLLLLMQLMGTLSRPRLQMVVVAMAVLALLFPFFGALRTARVYGLGGAEAVRAAREDRDRNVESILDLIRPSVMRVSGAAALLPLIELDPIPAVAAAGFVSPIGISAYITVAVYGHEPGAPAAEAPGLLGWFHLAGGKDFVLPGVLVLLLLVELLWRIVWVVPLISRDVVLTLLAAFLLTVITDGVIESIGLPLLVIAGTAVGLEVVARFGLREPAAGDV